MDQAGERGVQLSIEIEGTLYDQAPPESNPIYVLGRARQETLQSPTNHTDYIHRCIISSQVELLDFL